MGTTGSLTRVAGLAAAGLLCAATLAGCGSGSSATAQDPSTSAPSSSQSAGTGHTTPTSPRCTSVWRSGAVLPAGYHGCATGAGWVKAEVYQCSDGHRLVTYAHAFYAAPGRSISRAATTLAKDHGFRHTMAVCGA